MFSWNLWWIDQWMAGEKPLLDCRMLHHPFGIDLKFHTLSLANGVLISPVTRHWNPVIAHNLLLILHAIFTSFAMYLLARQMGIGWKAALITSAIYTWWPARRIHSLVHLNLASTGWMILTILAFVRAGKTRDRRWLIVSLAGFVLTGASSWHLLQQLILLLPVFLLIIYPDTRHGGQQTGHLILLLVLGLLILSPLILPFAKPDPDYAAVSEQEKETYSIPLAGLLIPPVDHPVFHSIRDTRHFFRSDNLIETTGFIGFSSLILLMLGLIGGSGKERRLIGAGFIFLLLAFGPAIRIGTLRIPMIYQLVDAIPGMGVARTPGRFMIAVALLWSLAFSSLLEGYMKHRRFLFIAIGLLALLDFFPGRAGMTSLDTLHVFDNPKIHDRNGILDVPNDWSNPALMLGQTRHGSPMTTGFCARMPSTVFDRIRGIPKLPALSDPKQASTVMEQLSTRDLARLRDLLDIDTLVFHGQFCDPPRQSQVFSPECDIPSIVRSKKDSDYILDLSSIPVQPGPPEIYLLDRWSGPENWMDGGGEVFWGLYPAARLRIINISEPVRVQFDAIAARQLDSGPVTVTIRSGHRRIFDFALHASDGWQRFEFTFNPSGQEYDADAGNRNQFADLWLDFSSGTRPVDLSGKSDTALPDMRYLSVAIRQPEIHVLHTPGNTSP